MKKITQSDYLEMVRGKLTAQLVEKAKAMPPGFNKDRFTMNCLQVLQDMLADKKSSKNLIECNINSLVMAFMKGALLDLNFFNGECYIIPYGGVASFQTNYRGEIKLCKKYSKNKIRDIYAKNVRKGDFFEEAVEEGRQRVTWKPIPFNDEEIIGSFAVVLYEDGSMIYDTMSKNEIEYIRKTYSKMQDSPAWTKSPGEMYKKTVLRRLTKLVDIDFANVEQAAAYEDGSDAVFESSDVIEKASDEAVDVFATEVEELKQGEAETKQIEEKPKKEMPGKKMKQPEPVPVRNEEPEQEDFSSFEEQYMQYEQGSFDDYAIPDEE